MAIKGKKGLWFVKMAGPHKWFCAAAGSSQLEVEGGLWAPPSPQSASAKSILPGHSEKGTIGKNTRKRFSLGRLCPVPACHKSVVGPVRVLAKGLRFIHPRGQSKMLF